MVNFKFFGEKLRKIVKFVKIDFSFILLFALAFVLEEIKIYFLFVMFICLHEFSHLWVAKKLGYMATKIHLTFFGASLEGLDEFVLDDEIKIVLAGPLFNLVIVVLCYLCFWFYPESYHYLNEILLVNWSIFLFNFLPIYPLDLGRILLAFFCKKYSRKDALKITKTISLIFILFLFIIFITSFFFEFNFTLGFVCVNLCSLLFKSSKDTSFKRSIFVRRKYKLLMKGLQERTIYVAQGYPEQKLFKFIDENHFFNFIFLDEDFNYVTEKNEIEVYRELGLLN